MPARFETSTLCALPVLALGKRQDRIAEYHYRAHEASAQADASVLDHVREKHQVAAARWTELALLTEGAKLSSPVRAGAPEEAPSLEASIAEDA